MILRSDTKATVVSIVLPWQLFGDTFSTSTASMGVATLVQSSEFIY